MTDIICYRCGQAYADGECGCKDGICLIHADCRDVLPLLSTADLVLTDPPYGIGEAAGKNKSRGKLLGKAERPGRRTALAYTRDYGNSTWDNKPIDDGTMRDVVNAGKRACVWGGNYYTLGPSPCWLVWDKENHGNDFADCELAWTNYPGAVRIKRHMWNGMLRKGRELRQHPTQKPRDVMRWCIELSKTEGTILDPYVGSGTTLRAAKDLGRRAIGIEIELKYVEIAAERLRQEVLPLHD